ncbi:glycosyltransferase family 2 protein [Pseudooceanicola nanhaiensis]|uniref:glycosyltransferase family 2 protein n=1 Tax=Pseudooceanicola nanhaiensis TaxID=375761 RepID=UPI003513CB7C
MRIVLHIGVDTRAVARLQSVLAAKRGQLAAKGVLFPRSPGNENHTRLFMAVTDPDHVDTLRDNRGFAEPARQARLREDVTAGLAREIAAQRPETLVLSAVQLGQGLARRSELERLRDMLSGGSDDIRVVAHVDAPASLLARHYAAQVLEGRASGLEVELGLGPEWWEAALAATPAAEPAAGIFAEVQGPAFWLDYERLASHWESVFGAGRVALRSTDDSIWGPGATEEIRAAFGIEPRIGKAEPATPPAVPSAAWLARGRAFNALTLRMLARRDRVLPRPLQMRFMEEMRIDGEPIDPASLSRISERFAPMRSRLERAHPGLHLPPPPAPADGWQEADPRCGFRASQYLSAFLWRIDKATAEARAATRLDGQAAPLQKPDLPPEAARAQMPPEAIRKYQEILRSPFRPHNRLGSVDEETPGTPYAPAPARTPGPGSSGNLIVACMKDEAPYVLEWIAYHRAIGFDTFLIYTNDCSDGTDAILARLDEMGVVHHRDNTGWTGNSPQQCALDAAMAEPVFRNAAWIAHIDVDEFVNIRCGNGTLGDLFARTGDATNIAMTWRLFGHDGVTRIKDRPVIAQFTSCAPKFAPKPHTAWGFKTLFRNNGVYSRLSCHRPNRPDPDRVDEITWVNGSGAPMGPQVVRNGWRNSRRSIGYDLVQLNHYALRSADSYLVKRQRGRALHVDRSIGLNYWIRMDWNDTRDVTIQRNLPRLKTEMARLRADPTLEALHAAGLAWHRAKAEELRDTPEFRALYDQALGIRLNGTERVAYALALDMES